MTKEEWLETLPKGQKITADKAAQLAAERGYVFVPCSKSKRAMVKWQDKPEIGQKSQASSDPGKVKAWAMKESSWMAYLTGECGLFVVDVDTKAFPDDPVERDKLMAIVAVLAEQAGHPPVPSVNGGMHFYFKAPEGPAWKDTPLYKAEGSMFEHGHHWVETRSFGLAFAYGEGPPEQLAELPRSIIDAYQSYHHSKGKSRKKDARNSATEYLLDEDLPLDEGLLKCLRMQREGARNTALNTLGYRYFRVAGVNDETRAKLTEAARETGLPDDEIEGTVNSAAEAAVKPTRYELRRKSWGVDLERHLRQFHEYDEEGRHLPHSLSEAVRAYWPQMRYYENPATDAIEKRGAWLEIQGDKWVTLRPSEVLNRLRRAVKLTLPSQDPAEINKETAENMKMLHADCLAGTTDRIDASDHILDSEGRVIDINKGVVVKPDPAYPLMRRLNVKYDPKATSKHFVECLRECLSAGRNAVDASKTLQWYQRVCGYRFKRRKREQMFILHVGVGDNGKTTVMEAQLNYLGRDFAHVMNADPLMLDYKGDPLTGFNAMIGKFMTFVEELPEGKTFNTGVLKMLTGGREFEIRKRYEDNKVVENTALIEVASNTRPAFSDNSRGWGRRPAFVQWMADFTDTKDKDMPEKLDQDGSGWLNWALAGLREYNRIGEARPQCIKDSTADYVLESGDPLRKFFDTMVTPSEADTPLKTLREAYRNWLINSGVVDSEDGVKYYTRSPQEFRTKMQNMTGAVYENPNGRVKMVRGFVLTDDDLLATPKRDRDGNFLTSEAAMELVKDA